MTISTNVGYDRSGSLFRLYMSGTALITGYIAFNDPRSLMFLLATITEGAILVWLLMLIGIVGVVDAVINDFMSEHFQIKITLHHRHFILAAMAFCYVAQLFVAFYHLRSTGLLFYYLWNAITLMVVAFIDAHQRSKDASCVIICN